MNDDKLIDQLRPIIDGLDYYTGWEFHIAYEDDELTLHIYVLGENGYRNKATNQRDPVRVRHSHLIPRANYSDEDWQRWLLDRIMDVHRHEAMEGFTVNGHKPFAPLHGDGRNPYVIQSHSNLDTLLHHERTRRPGEG